MSLPLSQRDRGTVRGRDIEREACVWSDKGLLTAADGRSAILLQLYAAAASAQCVLSDGIARQKTNCCGIGTIIALCMEKGFPSGYRRALAGRMKQWLFSASYLKTPTAWNSRVAHTVSEVTALEPEISEETRAVTRPPFGAVTSAFRRRTQKVRRSRDWEKGMD